MEFNMNDLTKLEGKTIKNILLKEERPYNTSEILEIKFTDGSELTIESASWEDSGLILEYEEN